MPAPPPDSGGALAPLAVETITKTRGHFAAFAFSRALEAIWALIGAVDKYLVEQKPWVLIKQEDEASEAQLWATLYNAAEVLRIATALVSPVLPKAAAENMASARTGVGFTKMSAMTSWNGGNCGRAPSCPGGITCSRAWM